MIVSLRRGYGQIVTSGVHLVLLGIGARLESQIGWTICLSLIAIISFFAWASALRWHRTITDTPTSRIASAAQGYLELSGLGKPLDDAPLHSHLTTLPCLWYRYLIEKKRGDKWETLSEGESDVSFIIDDGSGRCVVDVDGAEILTRHKETWTKEGQRYTEWKLLIDDPVYALGEFRTLGGSSAELDARHDMNNLLAEWKKNKAELHRRFDLNGDGDIDMQEWMLARQAARREVLKMHQEIRNESDVHTLRRPSGGQLFLLSNLDPGKISRRYLWWAAFHLVVFFGSLAALPWIWQQTFRLA